MNERQRPKFFSSGSGYRADAPSILEDALETMLRHSSAARGNIQLTDSRTGGLRIASQRGFSDPFLRHFELVADDSSACGRALALGVSVRVADVATSPVFAESEGREVMLDAGAYSVQSAPFHDRAGRPLGVVSLHYERPHGPTGNDQRLMLVVARRTSLLLQK
ncbi:GAF domain-containing protein [Spirillospora sp. NPDC047279]|uniref:GAF domain-containing protein n=1 Tax=Spirillospora sp. NPDC047279 TaxID=3155478 RepID=UPI0033E6A466